MSDEQTNWPDVFVSFLFLSYMLAAFGGTAYMVQTYSWSPWWFLFTACCMMVKIKTGKRKK